METKLHKRLPKSVLNTALIAIAVWIILLLAQPRVVCIGVTLGKIRAETCSLQLGFGGPRSVRELVEQTRKGTPML